MYDKITMFLSVFKTLCYCQKKEKKLINTQNRKFNSRINM